MAAQAGQYGSARVGFIRENNHELYWARIQGICAILRNARITKHSKNILDTLSSLARDSFPLVLSSKAMLVRPCSLTG